MKNSPLLLLTLLLSVSLTLSQSATDSNNYNNTGVCYAQTYARMPIAPLKGCEQGENIQDKCYGECPAGYTVRNDSYEDGDNNFFLANASCWQECPQGYTDKGTYCQNNIRNNFTCPKRWVDYQMEEELQEYVDCDNGENSDNSECQELFYAQCRKDTAARPVVGHSVCPEGYAQEKGWLSTVEDLCYPTPRKFFVCQESLCYQLCPGIYTSSSVFCQNPLNSTISWEVIQQESNDAWAILQDMANKITDASQGDSVTYTNIPGASMNYTMCDLPSYKTISQKAIDHIFDVNEA